MDLGWKKHSRIISFIAL